MTWLKFKLQNQIASKRLRFWFDPRSPSRWPLGHCSRPLEFGSGLLLGRLVHEPEQGEAEVSDTKFKNARQKVHQIQDSNFQTQRFKIPTFKLRDSKFVMPDSQHRTPASIQETLPLTLSSWPWLREEPQKKPTRANNHLPWSYDQLDAWPWSCVIRWELIVWVPDTLPGATGRSFWLNNRQLTLKYESDTVSLWVWLKYESDTVRI